MPVALKAARLGLVLLLTAGLVLAFIYRGQLGADQLNGSLAAFGPWLPLAFIGYHLLASLFFVPRLIMCLIAGALYGHVYGGLLALVAGTLGAMAGFGVGRLMGLGRLDLGRFPRAQAMLTRAETAGWRAVFVARLVPAIPHSLTNYAFGATPISWRDYSWGTLLGLVPTTILYVEMGVTGRLLFDGAENIALAIVWGIGLLALASVLPRLFRRLTRPSAGEGDQ